MKMPYRRRYRSYRRRRPKRNLRTMIRRTVNRMNRKEVKQMTKTQTEVSLNTLSQAPYALSYSAIAAGTSDYTRIGNQVKAIGLNFKGALCNNGASPNFVRILLINQQNPETDITSTSTPIFDTNETTSISSLTGIGTMYSPINKSTYQVLYDKVFKLAPTGDAAGGNVKQFRKFIKLNHVIKYQGSAAGDCTHNNLRVMAFSAEAPNDVGAGQVIEFTAYGTLFYTDI